MSTYTIILLSMVTLWLIYGLLGPKVKRDSRARHNAAFLWFPIPYRGNSHGPSVWVQEDGEWRLSKMLACLAGYLLIYLLPTAPQTIFIVAISMAVVDSFSRKFVMYDVAGHGAEIIAAERSGITGYREAEVSRMAGEPNFKKKWPGNEDIRKENIDRAISKMKWLSHIMVFLSYKKYPSAD